MEADMEPLLTTIVLWLSINFGLTANYEPPRIEYVPPAKMAAVRYSRLAALRPDRFASEAGRSAPAEVGQDVNAIYDDLSRTLYLPERWTSGNPAHVSLLVHEMVHHLQNLAGEKFMCAQEREKDAYKAQRAWLALFDRTLEQEFGIDPMTVLVRTNCMF
jgi:hypothetical protein